jgi:hypothetical protein
MDKITIGFPLKNGTRLLESDAVKLMAEGINKLIKINALKGNIDDILLDYEFNSANGYCIATIKKDALVDSSKLNTVGSSLIYPLEDHKEALELEDKGFSVATIQERLKLSSMDSKVRFRMTVMDYKRYWKANQSKIKDNPSVARRLKNMFIVDLMGIFTEILPYIQDGKQLNQLVGLNTVTEGLNNISRELSIAYKRALQQSKTGQLSKTVFTKLKSSYSDFINALIPQIFPGINEIITGQSEGESKSFSETIGFVNVCTNVPDKIYLLLDKIKDALKDGNEFSVDIPSIGFNITFDKNDEISSLEIRCKSIESYESTSDGRISILKIH